MYIAKWLAQTGKATVYKVDPNSLLFGLLCRFRLKGRAGKWSLFWEWAWLKLVVRNTARE